MPANKNSKTAIKPNRGGTGAAGVSGGTVLALVANSLPPNSSWKPWLILVIPWVSALIGAVAIWANHFLDDYLNNMRRKIRFDRLKRTIELGLSNANTSGTHKDELREQLEKIEKLQVETDFELLVK